jgi:antitoxin component of MazEF toxin-antitoxin module
MPVFESSRKVQVFGSSLALTLPAMFVKVNEIEKGSKMNVLYGLDGVLIISNITDKKELKISLINIIDEIREKTKE